MITRSQLANMFDHSLLKPNVSLNDLAKLCIDADQNGFKMVAINSCQVKFCKSLLKHSSVHVGAAIGFPFGQTSTKVKVFETASAIQDGADEIDYVLNISELKDGNFAYIRDEMEQIVSLCRKHKICSKVIFENCYLTKDEIKAATLIAKDVKPDFVKTSTGFGTGGATLDDVILMVTTLEGACQVKAAGGIRDWATCKQMINAGASRIGTAFSFDILKGYDEEATLDKSILL